MFNIADIIVIVIILITTFMGYKKGFVKTGFGILSFFIAIALTFMFYKPVMSLIKEKTNFENLLYEYLYSMNLDEKADNNLDSGDTEIKLESGESYLEKLPQSIVDMIGIEDIKENVKVTVTEKIVEFALKLLSIIIVYIASKLILMILVVVLDSIAKLPILKQFNELFGLILGFVLGMIRVYVVCTIVTLISAMPIAQGLPSIISNSLIAHIFYDNNLLLKILF